MAITDWPEHDRPRERLLAQGPRSLSDAELLAIFLRVGVRGKTAVDLAQDLLVEFRSLRNLFNAPPTAFRHVKGFGPAKYVQLQAVHEMARRALEQEMRAAPVSLGSPTAVREYLRAALGGLPHEVFVVIFLDSQNRVLHHEELFRGTLTQTTVHPREVVKRALAHNAASVIFAHNHPSGVAEPSRADETLTRALRDALALVEVKVLDHFVVGAGHATSFAERGLL